MFTRSDQGVIAVLLAFLLPVLTGFLGLAIDIAFLTIEKQSLQNGIDLAVLATAQEIGTNPGQIQSTAIEFCRRNGINANEIRVDYPYEGDSAKVAIEAERKINLYFMPILGLKKMSVTAIAIAKKSYFSETVLTDQALDYVIFHGSTGVDLGIKGSGSVVNGNVHSNKKLTISGANQTINGNVSAVGGITSATAMINGLKIQNAPVVPMPSLGFDLYAARADQVFNSNQIFNDVNINGIWLINGNVTLNGGRITGRGIILSTGSITLAGNNFRYSSSEDLLALYSSLDIRIASTRANINGLLYAPNGKIRIDGSFNTVYGALIANEVIWATKDITIDGNYDIRVPQALTVQKQSIGLIK